MNSWKLWSVTGSLATVLLGLPTIGIAGQTPALDAKPEPPKTEAKKPDVKPGRDRRLVRTAADLDAREINPKPVKSSVEKLLALPRPVDLPFYDSSPEMQSRRARPAETTVWTVEARVKECRLMPDGDFRVTIEGPSGQTMILEMPNPAPEFVDPAGPFAKQIKAARDQFTSKAKPEQVRKPISLNLHARITGIGFFGRAYGPKKPIKGNLLQLHPVLNIEWLDKPTSEFTDAAKKKTP